MKNGEMCTQIRQTERFLKKSDVCNTAARPRCLHLKRGCQKKKSSSRSTEQLTCLNQDIVENGEELVRGQIDGV